MQTRRFALSALLVLSTTTAIASPEGNVLLVLVDDIGVDRIAAYGEHPDPGNTPVIDSLAQRGVLFRNAWATPLCSPTRVAILTGRHAFRTGIGYVIRQDQPTWPGLSRNEFTLPRALGPWCEIAGKWHMATPAQGGLHPLRSGFRHHRGSLNNLTESYTLWEKHIDGVPETSTTYATTDTVDDTIQLVQTLPEPWFIWMSLNAAHAPFHVPPDHLHSFDLSGPPWMTPVEHVKAAIEAMDTELARVLEVVDANTTIIFLGDNGTYGGATDAPFDPEHGKGTVYEGGINVPLIIAGPYVARPGTECDALVSATDLFATIIELSRLDSNTIVHPAHPSLLHPFSTRHDSVSLLPYLSVPELPSIRGTVYAELFLPNGTGPYVRYDRAMRDSRYKLIDFRAPQQDEFYDLLVDPFEQENLLLSPFLTPEQQTAYDNLRASMEELLASEG